MEVSGKAVFLTGGARGIGRAICESLLKNGAKVFFCDVNAETGKTTEAELQKQYGAENAIFAQCDVADADQFAGVFKQAVDRFGAVDVCVNNAGIVDERMWEQVVAVNMVSYIRGSLLAMEHMRRDKGGRGGVIINTLSSAGLMTFYHAPVYTATKHAMIGFVQSWAANPRMTEMGVRWGSLCPGAVDTGLLVLPYREGQVVDPEGMSKLTVDRMKPEVVADAFMTLLKDEDSNGALMAVWPEKFGIKYVKRQVVDSDGVSVMSDAFAQ